MRDHVETLTYVLGRVLEFQRARCEARGDHAGVAVFADLIECLADAMPDDDEEPEIDE